MENISSFKDEEQAYREIKEAGYFPFKADYPALENDFHWHDFDSFLYITGGELTVTEYESGESITCTEGTKITARAGVVHREKSPGYSGIFGLSVNPTKLTQPVDKPVSSD